MNYVTVACVKDVTSDPKADIAARRAEVSSFCLTQAEMATIREMEGALNHHDFNIKRWKSAISDHKQAVDKLKDRNDSVENRSCHQNLRIIEIPEDEENGRPTAMMAEM
ncbi:hypothetical protein ABVT39_025457 [Epinephelus coioides]